MPYYLKALPQCSDRSCTRQSTQQLFNTFNERMGDYCDKHGKEALARFQEAEEKGVIRR